MIGLILVLLVVGFIAGALARAVVPGTDAMGFLSTVALGLVGSFVGGFLGYILFHKDSSGGALQPSGFVGSVIGAIIALMVFKSMNGRRAVR